MAEIEMVIDSIRMTYINDQKAVILKEKSAERYLPIWMGPDEAFLISAKLEGYDVPRPLTHDLACSIADAGGLKIKRIIINKLESDTFYAKMILTSSDKSHEIDCRPCDALAIAVRVGAPIFADKIVLDRAGIFRNEEGKR